MTVTWWQLTGFGSSKLQRSCINCKDFDRVVFLCKHAFLFQKQQKQEAGTKVPEEHHWIKFNFWRLVTWQPAKWWPQQVSLIKRASNNLSVSVALLQFDVCSPRYRENNTRPWKPQPTEVSKKANFEILELDYEALFSKYFCSNRKLRVSTYNFYPQICRSLGSHRDKVA